MCYLDHGLLRIKRQVQEYGRIGKHSHWAKNHKNHSTRWGGLKTATENYGNRWGFSESATKKYLQSATSKQGNQFGGLKSAIEKCITSATERQDDDTVGFPINGVS